MHYSISTRISCLISRDTINLAGARREDDVARAVPVSHIHTGNARIGTGGNLPDWNNSAERRSLVLDSALCLNISAAVLGWSVSR